MSISDPRIAHAGLIARVKALLLQPTATWDTIDGEAATIGGLYRGYVIPLTAIPAACTFIGLLVFGYGGLAFSFRPSPIWLGVQLVVGYALSLAMVFVLALVIEALAPNFGGIKDRTQAFKVAAYAPTASWVAGVFSLLPALGIIGLLGGLYALYTLYKGLPKLMKAPQDKAGPYFAVVLVVAVVVYIVIGAITGAVMMAGMGGPFGPFGAGRSALGAASSDRLSGTVAVPGAGSIDLAKLQAASERAQLAAKQAQSGTVPAAVDPSVLKDLLPATVGGFARTDVSAASGGAGGTQASSAEATYTQGDQNLHLEVTDLGNASALVGMASAFNVNSSKQTATGYEKVGKVNGQMTVENYDTASRHGEFSVIVGERFSVKATGDKVTMDSLKAAVNAIPASRLEGLGK